MNSLFCKHDIHQLAHGMLHLLSGQYSHSISLLVHIKLDSRNVFQCSLVMLSLKSEIPLHIDEYLRHSVISNITQAVDVALKACKLSLGICIEN